MKPNEWLGYSADTNTDDARWRAARRLGCGVDEVEVESNGGAVLVRRRDAEQAAQRVGRMREYFVRCAISGQSVSPDLTACALFATAEIPPARIELRRNDAEIMLAANT